MGGHGLDGLCAPTASRRRCRLPGDPEVYPFLPVGLPGPAFLVSRNFNTIYRYNNSERYVMEVALLADAHRRRPRVLHAVAHRRSRA